jgi:two-component system sensor histidine kinase ChvG
VVLAVALAPVAMVGLATLYGQEERASMLRRVAAAAGEARSVDDDAALDAVARRHEVRIRVVDGDGALLHDHDYAETKSLRDRVGDLFFGLDGAPTLRGWEASAGPLAGREPIALARRDGHSGGCAIVHGGLLLVCHAAASDGARVALVEDASPRAIRALWEMRYPFLKLTLYVVIAGLLLATWLARRIVRPIEVLRSEVLARTSAPLASAPIVVPQKDEIAELAGAFNTLLGSIADKSRKNHAFMADLVHELKSPVAAVRAAAEALGSGPVDEARAERLARALAASGARLDALVSECLELARAEAGLPNEERSALDVAAMMERLCQDLRDDERYQGVRFVVAATPTSLAAVESRLERALANVLDNAASFAGEGGEVTVKVVHDEAACVITVRDSGPGFDREILPRLFDRFFSARPDRRGTGLGLALAKAIIEAHGGSIEASSPGGACFTVRLPRAAGFT